MVIPSPSYVRAEMVLCPLLIVMDKERENRVDTAVGDSGPLVSIDGRHCEI